MIKHLPNIACWLMLFVYATACHKVDPQAHKCEIATWNNFSEAAITYTFDDNLQNQLDIVAPIFDKHGVKGTFYVVCDWVDDWSAWAMMAQNGHEIGCHTISHPSLSQIEDGQVLEELVHAKEIVQDNITSSSCVTIAYPYCSVPNDTLLVEKNFIGARICNNHIEPQTPENFNTISSFGVGSESNYQTAESVISIFEKTRYEQGWSVLLFHEIDKGNGYSPYSSAALDSTLTYIDNQGTAYWVATFADVIRYIKERNNIKITLEEESSDEFSISFKSDLDASIFNIPLSVKRPLPTDWANVAVLYNGEEISSFVDNGYIYFDVEPNTTLYFVKR